MKIHQLPLGARFEYEGEEYVKTGPMAGTGPRGQRLIPKYAVLAVLGEGEPRRDLKALDRKNVLEAFTAFFETCEPLVPAGKRGDLRAARERFLKALG